MKVLQFSFDDKNKQKYIPYNYEKNSVCYTGTHDNSTLMGYYKKGNSKPGRKRKY